ncbi:hypothetical protein SAMN05216228_100235 [Rhizobium tibeticum]|uniref:Uncharacterized protein n=1 Tax=Rhizobium tibeticum TaxID=501024 RepID=A0A1H8DH98_9HYPH|nr:hypothetical protein [Rhizobium tibeticum]SEH51582.1 hypothetical protein RTCCBAU85039_0856 [Rhizobium tibeticum]SEN05907.1 hypothetical protein SAMN05216228_100235 [Rhizobium tibeticum]
MMVTDPGLNSAGCRLLYRVRLHARQNRRAYPLSLDADLRGVGAAIEGGYLVRLDDDPHLVSMTAKGEAYLLRLMRCE